MSDKLKVTYPKRWETTKIPRSSTKCDWTVLKKKIGRNWYTVCGRRSQYKIDTEELAETPEVNRKLLPTI